MLLETASADTKIDGRRQRSARTRQALIDAYIALLRERPIFPTSDQVSSRAEISPRTLFSHFPDMKTLGLAAFDYVLSCRTPAPPGDRLQAGRHARIRFQVEIRAGNCELWSPLWRVVMRGSAHSPDIAQRAEAVRSLSRARIELMYGAELATLTDHDRRAMVGLIESIQDYESWGRLRTTYRLSFADVCAAWVTAIDRLLPATPATAAAKQM